MNVPHLSMFIWIVYDMLVAVVAVRYLLNCQLEFASYGADVGPSTWIDHLLYLCAL
jgi:hypothetical protein